MAFSFPDGKPVPFRWQREPESGALPDRLPPQNIEAEQSLLGSILLDNEVLPGIVAILHVMDFYRDSHQIAYQAILDLFEEGNPVDAVTLADKLISQGVFQKIGGDELLRDLVDAVPHSANALYYAGIVKRLSISRRVIDNATEVIRAGYDGQHSPEELLAMLSRAMVAINAEPAEEEPTINPLPDRMAEAAYRGVAGELVKTLCPQTEACAEAILGQFLVGFGNLMGPRPHWAHGGIVHRSNLFICLVGPTGEGRKGTSWGNVRWALGRCDDEWANKPPLSSMTSGEGVIRFIRDHPGPVIAIETEFDGLLARMRREGNSTSAVLRDAWDGPSLGVPTKNDPIFVDDSYLSVIGHITESDLVMRLKQNYIDNGVVNRFLWVNVFSDGVLPEGGDFESIEQALSPYFRDLIRAVNFAKTERFLEKPIRKTRAARELWSHLYCGELRRPKGGNYAKATIRAAPLIMRMAVIYCMLDRAREIDVGHLEGGLAFWRYCDGTAAHLFGDVKTDDHLPKIIAHLESSPRWLSRTQINREVFFGRLPAGELDRLLVQAQGSGLLQARREQRGPNWLQTWMHRKHLKG
jgi:DnaB-like helicase N terminal domain/Protein of unknown function (DUF3987)